MSARSLQISAGEIIPADFLNDGNSYAETSQAAVAAAAAAIAASRGSHSGKTNQDYDDHMKYKSHHCNQCNQSFARAHDLKRHKMGLHDQVKPFPCPHCGRSFSRQDALSRHLKISETGRAACSALREGKAYDADSPGKKRRYSLHESSSYASQIDHAIFFHQDTEESIDLDTNHQAQLAEQNKQLYQQVQSLEAQLMRKSILSKELEGQVKQLEIEKEILRSLLSDKSSPNVSSNGFGHSKTVGSGSYIQKV